MNLDEKINYIVSGLERSGTSLMMQILRAGMVPIFFDESRKPDDNNPKGYYELEGGKIINSLMNNTFPMSSCSGKFIKITAFGLTFLPPGCYKIIYMERDLDEVLDSMEKMAKIKDDERNITKESFRKLNEKMKTDLQIREDVDFLLINYNDILSNPKENINRIVKFLNLKNVEIKKMTDVIDNSLYRQRRN